MDNADPEDVELEIEAEADAMGCQTLESNGDPAAEAFARLEGEMALVRRAVQQLAAERADIIIPDYGPTLVKMSGNLDGLGKSLRQIEAMPALEVTPEDFGQRIAASARSARARDESMIQQWKSAAYGHERALTEALGSAVAKQEQRRREGWALAVGAALAAALMTILPGVVARELPASWQLPERMARRVLDAPTIVDAGIHLIRSQNPKVWEEISEASALSDAIREAIRRCKSAARKAGHSVHCQVRVDG